MSQQAPQTNQKISDTRGNSNGFTFRDAGLKVPDQSNREVDPEQSAPEKQRKMRRSSNIQEADHDSDSNTQAPNFGGQGENATQQSPKKDLSEFDDDQEAPANN